MGQFKYSLGVITGTVLAMIIIFLLEMLNMKFYPLPTGYSMADMSDVNKAKELAALMPDGAFISILFIYAIGSYFGGLIAAIISGKEKNWPSIVTGVLLFGMGLWYGMEMLLPMWFMAGCLACIPFAWYGYYCVKPNN